MTMDELDARQAAYQIWIRESLILIGRICFWERQGIDGPWQLFWKFDVLKAG